MSNWRQIYESKLITEKEAVNKIKSHDCVFAGCNVTTPTNLLELLADRKDELEGVKVIGGTSLYPYKILKSSEYRGRIDFITVFLAGYEVAFKKMGNIDVNSVHLSRVAQAITDVMKANVLMIECSEPDEEGYLYFSVGGTATGWEIAQKVETTILQVNKYQPKTAGVNHRIHVNDVTWICEKDTPLPEFPQPEATEIELKIANLILPLIPDGACLQIGLGGLPNAIGFGLDGRKNLSVFSEMYTDSMVYLAKKGAISGKQVAAFGLGMQSLYDYIAEGHVELMPISYVNNPYEIGKNDNFISINGALMSDLTGQVCSESIGYRQYSSTGGQLDFVRGAALSKGGKSFLCMTSTFTDKSGNIESRIKVTLPPGAVVTTPRSDVMYIVTEYGIADLFLKTIEERVEAMISIAHPDFREQLRQDAIREGIIRG